MLFQTWIMNVQRWKLPLPLMAALPLGVVSWQFSLGAAIALALLAWGLWRSLAFPRGNRRRRRWPAWAMLLLRAATLAAVLGAMAVGLRSRPDEHGLPEAGPSPTEGASRGAPAASDGARASRVLLVEGQAGISRALADLLRRDGVEVDSRPPGGVPPRPEDLAEVPLVILFNVPGSELAERAMETLREYVERGGGLLVIGGPRSLTAGGYDGTALERALPVLSRFDRPQPRQELALVLVLDRSGSMKGAPIALAREATRRAIEALQPQDQVGVLAFNETAEWLVPIQPCTDKPSILQGVDRIEAAGRTDTGAALRLAERALDECFAARKHVLLLTDGLCEPDDFTAIASSTSAAGITISTVGVGPDVSRSLLEELAAIGKGRAWFCQDMATVPRVFALETASAMRQGIVERSLKIEVVGSGRLLPAMDWSDAPPLLGYVGTQLKPGSELLLAARDAESSPDAADPLLAWCRYGRGVSVVFTSDAEGHWAAAWLEWPGFRRFWTGLVRTTIAETGRRDAGQDRTPTASESHPFPADSPIWAYLALGAAVLFVIELALRRPLAKVSGTPRAAESYQRHAESL